jgi:hypothetical protein
MSGRIDMKPRGSGRNIFITRRRNKTDKPLPALRSEHQKNKEQAEEIK